MSTMTPDIILQEIGRNPLPGLNKIDNIFQQIKEQKDKSKKIQLIFKLEKECSAVFKTEFDIDLHFSGNMSNNCGVLPIYKNTGKIVKEKNDVQLLNIKKVYIIIGHHFIGKFSNTELTSILLHEIGHIVNHLSFFMHNLRALSSSSKFILDALNHVPIINAVVLPLLIICSRTFSFTNHTSEYNADHFAIEYGYGDEIANVIKKLNDSQSKANKSSKRTLLFFHNLKNWILGNTHPNNEQRIKRILKEIVTNYSHEYDTQKIKKILDSHYRR